VDGVHTATGQGLLQEALAERLPETSAHSGRVGWLGVRVGRRLGLPEGDLVALDRAGELHDVGKLAIPLRLLSWAGPLDAAERAGLRLHAPLGGALVGAVAEGAALAPVVRAVHERWDGRGYPDGLAGDEVPLHARVLGACDAFDAMVSGRPHRPRLQLAAACEELRRCAGGQFDPVVVRALLDVLEWRA
jgi:HD-GYP domain-containing protein (c-di-GMP phosphodiesterase class II)